VAELSEVRIATAGAFRDEWGQVVATLIRMTGDWDLAEECAQEALASALEHWPKDGLPRNPGAWLTTTARNNALNRLRRAAVETDKLQALGSMTPTAEDPPEGDDDLGDGRLSLIFACCHPALALEGQVALTLRTLTALSTADIARALLVSEPTLAQRLVRAKRKIREAGIPFRVPPEHLLPERTAAVMAVIYLLFNEGYSFVSGAGLVRPDLCEESIYLARMLARLMPDEPEVTGLFALLLFQNSRRSARLDCNGRLVSLEDQDRQLWDRDAIAEGVEALDRVSDQRSRGPYQVQAAIAAEHATSAIYAETDWRRIAALYDQLVELLPTSVVELNRAVAIAFARGPDAGLEIVDALEQDGRLAGYHLLPATQADLLRRLGRSSEAAVYYKQALELAHSDSERDYLRHRLVDVEIDQKG
jgi:RNA polymerase sigma-70 factor (ECF subfamily)